MDVSPGPFDGAQQTPQQQQRAQAAADQGASPASVRPRSLWEATDESAADQAAPEPFATANSFTSKSGLSRFAPNASGSASDHPTAEVLGFRFQSQPQTNGHLPQTRPRPNVACDPDARERQQQPGQTSGASEATAAAATASTAAGAAAATAAAAAQVSDAHGKAAAALDRLAAGFAGAADGGPLRSAPGHTAATARPSATPAVTSANGQYRVHDRGAGASGAPAQSSNAPDLETAFGQSLHVGPKPAQGPVPSNQVSKVCGLQFQCFLEGMISTPFKA